MKEETKCNVWLAIVATVAIVAIVATVAILH
jgi:hypothetical protein